jgi:hypothetical protein
VAGLQPEVVVPAVVVPVVDPVPVVVVVVVVVPVVPLVVVPAVVPLVPLVVDPPVPVVVLVEPLSLLQPAASSATVQQRMDALTTTDLFIAEFSLNAGRKGHQREPSGSQSVTRVTREPPFLPHRIRLGKPFGAFSKRDCLQTNVNPATTRISCLLSRMIARRLRFRPGNESSP